MNIPEMEQVPGDDLVKCHSCGHYHLRPACPPWRRKDTGAEDFISAILAAIILVGFIIMVASPYTPT